MIQEGVLDCGPFNTITKGTLSFAAKAWWMLVWHKLSSTKGDNVSIYDRSTLVADIMEGYEIDVAKIIAKEICDQDVSLDTSLAFLYLLRQLFLEEGVPEIPGID